MAMLIAWSKNWGQIRCASPKIEGWGVWRIDRISKGFPNFSPSLQRHNNLRLGAIISRDRGDRAEWRLSAAAWAEVERAFGPHTVDLFAARNNTLLPRCFSRFLDMEAAGEDAMQQEWGAEDNPHAHPPFVLLPQVLRKVREDRVPELSIVAPVWPGQHWLPSLMEMSVKLPVLLLSDPLLTPHIASRWRPSQPRWSTAVWRISGIASRPKVALQAQWSSLWEHGAMRASS